MKMTPKKTARQLAPISKFMMTITPQERLHIKTRLRLLGYKTLRAYRLSPHWARRRAVLRKKACERCGHDKVQHLQVHHLTYARLGRELETDVATLCRDCHKSAHGLHRKQGTLPRYVPKHVKGKIDRGRAKKKS